jgi:hypothetical protein
MQLSSLREHMISAGRLDVRGQGTYLSADSDEKEEGYVFGKGKCYRLTITEPVNIELYNSNLSYK